MIASRIGDTSPVVELGIVRSPSGISLKIFPSLEMA